MQDLTPGIREQLSSWNSCLLAPWVGTAAGIDAVRPQRNRLPATVRRSLDFLAGRLADYRADAAAERTAW